MKKESRYSCQLNLPGFDKNSQDRLKNSRVLIVGVGGLGCPAAQYLVSAGVGNIGLTDFDIVSRSNLHRQILFSAEDVGKPKVNVAEETLGALNSEVKINPIKIKITNKNAEEIIKKYDLVLDCTDNFEVRLTLNDACVIAKKPLIYGAAYRYEGQVAVWNFKNKDGSFSPNYRDVFPDANRGFDVDCASGGVMPTLTGVIGCMQAGEAIKIIAKLPGRLSSQLFIYNALTGQSKSIKLPKKSLSQVSSMPADVPEINVSELRKNIKDYELIDIRTPDRHEEYNIGGYCEALKNVTNGVLKTSSNKPIVFYCTSGKKSILAAQIYIKNNPDKRAYSLAGGISAWQDFMDEE